MKLTLQGSLCLRPFDEREQFQQCRDCGDGADEHREDSLDRAVLHPEFYDP